MRLSRRVLLVLAALAIAFGTAYIATNLSSDAAGNAPNSAQSVAVVAAVSSDVKRDHRYEVFVPESSPTEFLSARSETIKQGDVVEFEITSSRPGDVIVHGLLDFQPVVVNGQVAVAFRAIYSGRFGLHFHGHDGSHFELMSLTVMPAASGAE